MFDRFYRYFSRPVLQVMVSLLFLIFIILAGTVAYIVLNDMSVFKALYQTVNIVTTLGLKDLSSGRTGEIITFAIAIVGISSAFFAFSVITSTIIGGELRSILGRRNVNNKITNLHGHYIVCGYGRMGQQVCRDIRQQGKTVVVIEQKAEMTAEAELAGLLYVLGSAHKEQSLLSAGIRNAAGLVTVLTTDADNVFVALSTREINENIPIVARAEDADTIPTLKRAGATFVISPHSIGARKMACVLTNPALSNFMDLATEGESLEMIEAEILKGSKLIGQSLSESQLRQTAGVLVISITGPDGNRVFNPPPKRILAEGDRMLCIGETGTRERLTAALNAAQPPTDR